MLYPRVADQKLMSTGVTILMVGVVSPGSGLSIGPGLVAKLCTGSPDYVNLRIVEK